MLIIVLQKYKIYVILYLIFIEMKQIPEGHFLNSQQILKKLKIWSLDIFKNSKNLRLRITDLLEEKGERWSTIGETSCTTEISSEMS